MWWSDKYGMVEAAKSPKEDLALLLGEVGGLRDRLKRLEDDCYIRGERIFNLGLCHEDLYAFQRRPKDVLAAILDHLGVDLKRVPSVPERLVAEKRKPAKK